MDAIYDVGWRWWKLRFVMVVSLVAAAGAMFGGVFIFREMGLHPTEGGVLAPLGQRAALGGGMMALGLGIVGGLWAYGRCYVLTVLASRDDERLRIRLSGIFIPTWLEIGPGDVATAEFQHGQAHTGGMAINAPWYKVRIRGRRLPLILDLQGDFLDEARVDRLLLQWEPMVLARYPVRSGPGIARPRKAAKSRKRR